MRCGAMTSWANAAVLGGGATAAAAVQLGGGGQVDPTPAITASPEGVRVTDAAYVYAETPTPADAVAIFDGWLFTTHDGEPRDWTLPLAPGPHRVVAIGADGGGIDITIDVPMRGDFNGDGAVTAADLSIVLDGFDDGTHTAADLSAVLDHFGGDTP